MELEGTSELAEIRAEPPCEACGSFDPAEKPHATHGGSDALDVLA
jgi:hypothetical protein